MTNCENPSIALRKQNFEVCSLSKLSRQRNCPNVVTKITTTQTSSTRPPFNEKEESKLFKKVGKYRKMDFSHVIFTDDCRSML